MGFSPPSLGESEDDTPVLFALVLDLRHRRPADLRSVVGMSAAAGLQINPGYFHQAYPPHAARRLDRHRAHELGLGSELLIGDPARADRMCFGDQRVEPGRDRL